MLLKGSDVSWEPRFAQLGGVGPLQILNRYGVGSHIQRSNHVAWDTNSHVLQGYTANAKAAWTPLAYQQDQQGLDHDLFYVLFSDSPN